MSNVARPHESITAARFAAALTELPLSSLFAKGAEIRNSIAHLDRSNEELKGPAQGGDQDCADAVEENLEVISRMHMRLELLKAEVSTRGFSWEENRAGEINGQPSEESFEANTTIEADVHSTVTSETRNAPEPGNHTQATPLGNSGGRLHDDELRRLMAERLDDAEDDEHDGLHL